MAGAETYNGESHYRDLSMHRNLIVLMIVFCEDARIAYVSAPRFLGKFLSEPKGLSYSTQRKLPVDYGIS